MCSMYKNVTLKLTIYVHQVFATVRLLAGITANWWHVSMILTISLASLSLYWYQSLTLSPLTDHI